ncbi:hypothetical protein [Streptomyces aureocirculatus]|uniref:hypothetical protein n=1 Tax=Streptomyces aureocirculatus TaxID=67275 RepID=UPI0018FE578A|nr:hypothetical protein [Streptomyces aureocirculatus]
MFLLAGGVVAGVGGVGELEVGAQDVDAGLALVLVGGVVGEACEGVDAAEADGWGVGAEFVDGLGEALGVQPGGFAVGAGLVDALAAVGDDQDDERAGPATTPKESFTRSKSVFASSFVVRSISWKSSRATRL